MATTKNVKKLPSGRLKYRGQLFSGFNEPKNQRRTNTQQVVLAKKGSEIKMVRFSDARKNDEARIRARRNCSKATDRFTAKYWHCRDY